MAAEAPAQSAANEVEGMRHLASLADQVVRMNTGGITHEESLLQPQPAGNCLNWVLGHLVAVYNGALPLLGEEPVMDAAALRRYDRGAPPLRDPGEAMPLDRLLAAWDDVARRVDAGLASLTPDALERPAPFSPGDDPDETVRSLVNTILFHQAYHAGQLGLLRRLAGREGAIP